MGWYTVTKTINGRKYLYLQMTYREGGKVRTKNKYLGPASSAGASFGFGAPTNLPTTTPQLALTASRKLAPIRRLKPKTRAQANLEAVRRDFEQQIRDNRDDIREARKEGIHAGNLKELDGIFKRAYKSAFKRNFRLK